MKKRYVQLQNGRWVVDLDRFFRSEEGKKALDEFDFSDYEPTPEEVANDLFWQVRIEGLSSIPGNPRLFVIRPDGGRNEIRRIEFMDPKRKPWVATQESNGGADDA